MDIIIQIIKTFYKMNYNIGMVKNKARNKVGM